MFGVYLLYALNFFNYVIFNFTDFVKDLLFDYLPLRHYYIFYIFEIFFFGVFTFLLLEDEILLWFVYMGYLVDWFFSRFESMPEEDAEESDIFGFKS